MAIVVGYVDTPEGEAALTVAANHARERGTRLVVILSDKRAEDADPSRDAAVERLSAELTTSGLDVEVRHLARGKDAAEDIVGTAEEIGAALIVIGLRRRSPVGKLLLGSNAQRILLDASCPVLAVKA